jgi:DNA-binding NarL/FixJ family response regulator
LSVGFALTTKSNTIRVLLVEDHPLTAEHVHSFLSSFPNIDVVGRAQDGVEGILQAATLQPHVVVMDINLPKMDGIAATREIRTRNPEIMVVGLTVRTEDYLVYAMLKAGAVEVVVKDKVVTDLYGSIQRAVAAAHPIVILEETPMKREAPSSLDDSSQLPVENSSQLLPPARTTDTESPETRGIADNENS